MLHRWSRNGTVPLSRSSLAVRGRAFLVRTVPFSDPRAYGDEDVPYWFEVYSETAEAVIGDELGVILEWNGLVAGQVHDHSAFTAIDAVPTDRDVDPISLTSLWTRLASLQRSASTTWRSPRRVSRGERPQQGAGSRRVVIPRPRRDALPRAIRAIRLSRRSCGAWLEGSTRGGSVYGIGPFGEHAGMVAL